MTPERHRQVCGILYEALELDAEEREAFLRRVCNSDASLRRELDSLLSSSEDVRTSFMRSSAFRLMLAPGARLGDYEVESLLGSGGMGEVYRARDVRIGKQVAIKVLPFDLSTDRAQLWRFEREARAAAALSHPNILVVFLMGEHEGSPYLVSEFLEGETLRDRLKRGRIAPHEAVEFALQIGSGLTAAHEKGIVHRDLKPENLFLTKVGQVKILDFGLAKLTQSPRSFLQSGQKSRTGQLATKPGVILGTIGYMSPEQARGQPTDAR